MTPNVPNTMPQTLVASAFPDLTTAILNSSLNAIVATDSTGAIVEFNRAAETIFGYERDYALGRNIADLIVPERLRDAHRAGFERFGKTGRGTILDQRLELSAIRSDGSEFPCELVISPTYHGDSVYLTASIQDISERVEINNELERRVAARTAELERLNAELFVEISERSEAEAKLRESQKMLSLVMENIPQFVFWKDRSSTYLGSNGKFAKAAGLASKDDVIGKTDFEMPWAKEESQWFRKVDARVMESNLPELGIVESQRQADGTTRWVETNKVPLHDAEGTVIGILGTYEDITDRQRAENEIVEMNLRLERQLSRIHALRRIDRAIISALDVDTTMDIVISEVRSGLDVDAACILLVDPVSEKYRFAAGAGFATNMTGEFPDTVSGPLLPFSDDFVSHHSAPLTSRGRIVGRLEVFHGHEIAVDDEWISFFNTLAGQASIAIDNATLGSKLQHANEELVAAYDRTIQGWAAALDLRDNETEGHSRRVTELTAELAGRFGIVGERLQEIRRGALLHDIGKMGIPDAVLLKPGPLTDEEWVVMRKHPEYAYQFLSPIEFLRPALTIPYCHHEKWDGTGYPCGLAGDQIPLSARLFAIVDVWDALRSDRPYRAAWTEERTVAHIQSLSGTHFQPEVVDAFIEMVTKPKLARAA